jgi:hypothetical protein
VTRPHKPKQRRNGAIYICMCFVTAGPFSSPSHPLLSSWDFSLIRPTTEIVPEVQVASPLRLAIMPSGEVNVRPLSRLAILHYSMLAFFIGRGSHPKGGTRILAYLLLVESYASLLSPFHTSLSPSTRFLRRFSSWRSALVTIRDVRFHLPLCTKRTNHYSQIFAISPSRPKHFRG